MTRLLLLAAAVAALDAAPAAAGMPSVTLTDVARMRLQSISFFLAVFAVASLAVWAVWNRLARDFPRLPRLSYPRALGLVGLWGLLFLLVLTMISGARELMTPGAWKKDGLTYTVADDQKPAADGPPLAPSGNDEYDRRARLESLRGDLLAYAAMHDGAYPPADADRPADRWATPHPSGTAYRYVPGRTLSGPPRVLAYEPELFGELRFVLFTDGTVTRLPSAELFAVLSAEAK